MKPSLGAKNCLYPLPMTVVGANVHGKPNYLAIAHIGILDFTSISVSLNKSHYTNAGIQENQTFSVNIPSIDLVQVVDYCGLVSGKNVDKAALFETFYGALRTAPMIQQCAVNMECELMQTLDFPQHDVFIGKIAQTYCEERYLTDGTVDLAKVQPFLFSMFDTRYWKPGEPFAKAWSIGKELKSA